MNNLLNLYDSVKICEYRGETYHVRDNGAVFRCGKASKRKRPLDEAWTFGNPDSQKGYFTFSSETVHRIVATAFHGDQPSEKHIVDHIDTNKKNNRPENLRWITRLENLLLNPITLSRVIFKYGSIENFLADPSKPINGELDQNFEWMRTVSKEESENAKINLLNWAKEGKVSGSKALNDWIHINLENNEVQISKVNTFIASLSQNVIQKNWKTPSEFPNCPTSLFENALENYKGKLNKGEVFSINQYAQSIVESSEINELSKELIVLTRSGDMNSFALAKVYVDKKYFVHESIGSFFTLIGAQKQFNLALGLEWNGEDSIDDYL